MQAQADDLARRAAAGPILRPSKTYVKVPKTDQWGYPASLSSAQQATAARMQAQADDIKRREANREAKEQRRRQAETARLQGLADWYALQEAKEQRRRQAETARLQGLADWYASQQKSAAAATGGGVSTEVTDEEEWRDPPPSTPPIIFDEPERFPPSVDDGTTGGDAVTGGGTTTDVSGPGQSFPGTGPTAEADAFREAQTTIEGLQNTAQLRDLTAQELQMLIDGIAARYGMTGAELMLQRNQLGDYARQLSTQLDRQREAALGQAQRGSLERGLLRSGIHAKKVGGIDTQVAEQRNQLTGQLQTGLTQLDTTAARLEEQKQSEIATARSQAAAGLIQFEGDQTIQDLLALLPPPVRVPSGPLMPASPYLQNPFIPQAPGYAQFQGGPGSPSYFGGSIGGIGSWIPTPGGQTVQDADDQDDFFDTDPNEGGRQNRTQEEQLAAEYAERQRQQQQAALAEAVKLLGGGGIQ